MEKPNYYAVLTANVRYDKTLTNFAKLLYAEISALSSKTGECWASNGYFANLYEVTKETVSRTITQLEKRGYVSLHMEYEDKQIVRRTIKLIGAIDVKVNTPIDKKVDTPIDKKVKVNTTSKKNTIKSEYIRDVEDFGLFWTNLNGRKVNKNDALRAYTKIDTELSARELAEKYNKLLCSREEKFVPYPQKWLRNEGWADVLIETYQEGGMYQGERIYRDANNFIITEDEWKRQKAHGLL